MSKDPTYDQITFPLHFIKNPNILAQENGVTIVEPEGGVSDVWADFIDDLTDFTHDMNKHWWTDEDRQNPLIVPTKLMLIVSELAEAMEGHRKGVQDDKLPHRSMLEVELADALVRLFDLAGALGLELGAAFVEKMRYNVTRADHKPEARAAAGGKKY